MTPSRCVRVFSIVAAFGVSAQAAQAQTHCSGAGSKSLKRMGPADVRACVASRVIIQNAIVQGKDVVDAAEESAGDVRIRDSVIENGLDFSDLPAVPILGLPEPLRNKVRALGMYQPGETVRVVQRTIELHNNRLLAGPGYDVDEYAAIALGAGRVVFAQKLDLLGSSIEGSARFTRAAFLGQAVFSGVRFEHRVTFDAAWFGGSGLFVGTQFQGTTLFTYSRFASTANFRRSRFDHSPLFDKARLCADAHFGEAVFAAGGRFVGARMASDANFLDAEFPKGADFSAGQFARSIELPRITAGGILTFANARIGALRIGSNEFRSSIDAELDFSGAWIARARIEEVRIGAPVSFARARMGPSGFKTDVDQRNPEPRMQTAAARAGCPAAKDSGAGDALPTPPRGDDSRSKPDMEFRGVDFSGVTFEDASLQGRVAFEDVTFRSGANFRRIAFKPAQESGPFLRFAGIEFDNVDLDWASVPDLSSFASTPRDRPTSELFQKLEDRYLKRGQLSDALQARRTKWWASVREARACLRASLPRGTDANIAVPACSEPVAFAVALRDAVAVPAWGFVSGFSTSLVRLLLIIASVDLAFAVIYFRFGRLMKRTDGSAGESGGIRIRPLVVPATFAPRERFLVGTWQRLWNFQAALALSTAVLLRLGESGLVARGSVGRIDLRYLIALEWLIGIPLLVDLIYTLTETQPFLQRLVTGTIG